MAKRPPPRTLAECDLAAILFSGICLIFILSEPALTLLARNPVVHGSACCASITLLPAFAITTIVISVLALSDLPRTGYRRSLFITGIIGNLCLLTTLCGSPGCHSPVVQFLLGTISASDVSWSKWSTFLCGPAGCFILMTVHFANQRGMRKHALNRSHSPKKWPESEGNRSKEERTRNLELSVERQSP